MARTKIFFPQQNPLFQTQIPVRITDLNYGNHVGNDSLLSIIHESRVQFLKHNDMSELDVKGASLIMSESLILYKNEGFYGDIFTVKIWAADISTVSFDLLYEISTEREGDIKIIAQAKTVMICFDYTNRKTCTVTNALSQILNENL